jgi:hypothetical protein
MAIKDIAITAPNNEVPFFPSSAWELTNADFGNQQLFTFNWIQAFWDSNDLAEDPVLVISNGDLAADGSLIASAIQFAFSGERINVKGKIILATGTDRRGVTVNSLPIDAGSPTDSFSKVIAYGGNY